jgi:uncharacterized protein YbjT (DUF2867 family)
MANEQNFEQKVFLVTGATGRQGGAVARHLIKRGHRVRALTRDPNKAAARALTEMGAEVVRGDLDDRASVERALEGAYGVFSVQNFWEAGYEREVSQGITLAEAAKAKGVKHFLYSSVGSSYRKTGIAAFDGKWEIEEHIRGIGLPYTIVRPTSLMEDWEEMREEIIGGTLAQPLDPDRALQQVSVEDIGVFAAMAFEDPERWLGREVDLAGDESTTVDLAQTFGRVIGREVRYAQVSWEEFREAYGEDLAVMYEWFEEVGYEADIGALREEYPDLTTFEEYLRKHGWEGAREKRKLSTTK